MSRSALCPLFVWGVLGFVPSLTRPGQALEPAHRERAHELDPSPDRPAFALEYRGALRAAAGAELPLLGRRSRTAWALLATPLFELHNQPRADSFLPNEYWRARIGLETWWESYRAESLALAVGLALEHESDHSTARVDSHWGFATLNDLALRELTVFSWGPVDVGVGAGVAFFFWSCTRLPESCRSYGGATTAGGSAMLSLDFGRAASLVGIEPFVALGASGVLGSAEVAQEERLVLHAGGAHTGVDSGLWQLFGLGYLGHDVGVHRSTRIIRELGVGLRWTPP